MLHAELKLSEIGYKSSPKNCTLIKQKPWLSDLFCATSVCAVACKPVLSEVKSIQVAFNEPMTIAYILR